MIQLQRLRIPLDITMTALSVILMGGTILFPDDRIHQILGMVLIALWVAHIALNRRWYASLAQASKLITSSNANDRRSYGAIFKGRYNPYRVMQTVVNSGVLLCALLLAVSGMMMAWFIPETVSVPLGFARTAHLVGSHWYYLFMCAHLGMHISMIFNRIKAKRAESADTETGANGGFDKLNHRICTGQIKVTRSLFLAHG